MSVQSQSLGLVAANLQPPHSTLLSTIRFVNVEVPLSQDVLDLLIANPIFVPYCEICVALVPTFMVGCKPVEDGLDIFSSNGRACLRIAIGKNLRKLLVGIFNAPDTDKVQLVDEARLVLEFETLERVVLKGKSVGSHG